jgi:hemerythrin-like domain-containing protein
MRGQRSARERRIVEDRVEAGVMDVLQVIRNGHYELKERLETLTETAWVEPEETIPLIRELIEEFAAHHEAEERVLFCVLSQFQEIKIVVDQAWEEHAAIDLYLQRIKRSHASVRWPAKIWMLRDLVELHMAREENRVFSVIEDRLGDGLEALAIRFEEEKLKRLSVPLAV